MSAKPLKGVDRSTKIETGNKTEPDCGRMVKRHVRSVHRERCRPQGIRSPLRQFSPVMSVDADDDGVNVPKVSTALSAMVSLEGVRRGSKPWHVWKEANLNSGEPIGSREGKHVQLTGGRADD
jgi:hypothetical protein